MFFLSDGRNTFSILQNSHLLARPQSRNQVSENRTDVIQGNFIHANSPNRRRRKSPPLPWYQQKFDKQNVANSRAEGLDLRRSRGEYYVTWIWFLANFSG
jgi:hypothetical protein